MITKYYLGKIQIDGQEAIVNEYRMEELRRSIYLGRTFSKNDFLKLNDEDKEAYYRIIISCSYRISSIKAQLFLNETKDFQNFLLEMEKITVTYIDVNYRNKTDTLANCYCNLLELGFRQEDSWRQFSTTVFEDTDETKMEILERVIEENTPIHLAEFIKKYDQERIEMQKDIAEFKQKRQEYQIHQGAVAWIGVVLIILWFVVYIAAGGQYADWKVQLILVLCLPVLLFGIFKMVNKAGGDIDDETKEKMKKWGDDWDK